LGIGFEGFEAIKVDSTDAGASRVILTDAFRALSFFFLEGDLR
jgi:hypothetical protein